jgi:large subunit ribosomal protein L21
MTVYAIIKTGGKQYRVQKGDTVYVELLTTPVGEQVKIDEVLMVGGEEGARVGAPRLSQASVLATVVEHGRDQKIRVFKYKKRKHYRRTKGHRQSYTAVKIDAIELGA